MRIIEKRFALFDTLWRGPGLFARPGKLVDATLHGRAAPAQHTGAKRHDQGGTPAERAEQPA